MSELDKFKRRLIRSVSRLLLEEKKSEQEVWEHLNKETKCDCKLLWKRMCELTVKKIKRLLPADDRPDSIAHIARLSFTDWLLFDLVLVHENIDVIDRDRMEEVKGQWKSLMDLFMLVQRFNIEGLEGTELAEAWSSVALVYNSSGRQCSPMMLQRRWYQLKELTRSNFYNLWFNYRGNQKLWDTTAQQYTPSKLQMAIAKRYPQVVTHPFPEWEELIQKKKVILPEEFGNKAKKENVSKPDGTDDLIVVEPVIETIDLGLDSDSEEADQCQDNIPEDSRSPLQNDNNYDINDETTIDESTIDDSTIDVDLTTVKMEPEVDGLSNVQILETTHLESEIDKDVDKKLEQQSQFLTAKRNLALEVSKFIDTTEQLVTDKVATPIETKPVEDLSYCEGMDMNDEVTDITEDLIEQKANAFLNATENTVNISESVEELSDDNLPGNEEVIESIGSVVDATEELIKQKAKEFFDRTEKPKKPEIVIEEDEVDDIIKRKADDFINKSDGKKAEAPVVTDLSSDNFIDNGIEFVDDGIEFVDDGIEYVDEDDVAKNEQDPSIPIPIEPKKEKATEESHSTEPSEDEDTSIGAPNPTDAPDEETPKFDLKLLMDPVVLTIKLDTMNIFKTNSFLTVRDKDILDKSLFESKPIKKSVVVKIKPEKVQETLNIIDNDNEDLVQVNSDNFQEETSRNTDDDSSDSSDDNVISDDQKVKLSSYLLQKPRIRNYNPIQLCKNPDFNTRLKRLTTGFFCLPRNCQLIKACKPMTIDLHKAFENKLVNGTLYLKTDGKTVQAIEKDNHSAQTTSVLPSAMPIQSLIDNTKMDINTLIGLNSTTSDCTKKADEEIARRNKVINLRDITEIRRINQKLLTAEVTPIQVQNNDNTHVGRIDEKLLITEETPRQIQNYDNTHVSLVDQSGEIHKDNAEKRCPTPIFGPKHCMLGRLLKSGPLVTRINPPSLVPISSKKSTNFTITNINQTTVLANKVPVDVSNTIVHKRKIGRPVIKTDKLAPKSKALPVYSQITRAPVAWNKRQLSKVDHSKDNLITIDTLNKMIVKLSGYDEEISKKKKKPWFVSKPPEEKTAPNESAKKNEGSKKTEEEKKAEKKSKRKKYCCWCQEKMDKLRTKGRVYQNHLCPLPMCNCCCRDQLIDAMKDLHSQNKLLFQGQQQHVSSSIESVVQESTNEQQLQTEQSNHVEQSTQTAPTPLVRVLRPPEKECSEPSPNTSYPTSSGKTVVEAVLNTELAQTLIVETGTNVGFNYEPEINDATPIISQEIVVNTDRSNEQKPAEFDTNQLRPVLKINIVADEPPKSKTYVPVPTKRQVLNNSISAETQTTRQIPLLQNPDINPPVRIRRRPLPDYKNPVFVESKQSGTDNGTRILLDGSKSCPIPTTVTREKRSFIPIAPKHDKVIYMNIKTIANKPTQSPICLGKNKILLTTVKFPRSFQRVPEEVQNPKVIPTLTLPQGVILVLMPNGELTYTIEPGVELDDAQIAALPNIIAAVKQQIDMNSNTTTSISQETPPSQDVIEILGDDEHTNNNFAESTNTIQEGSDNSLAKSNDVTDKTEVTVNSTELTANTQVQIQVTTTSISQDTAPSQDVIEILGDDENTNNNFAESTNTIQEGSDNSLAKSNDVTDKTEVTENSTELTANTQVQIQVGKEIPIDTGNSEILAKETTSESADLNTSKESNEIIEINEGAESSENSNSKADKIDENSCETAGTRSLLSDLMEMSGISPEDTTSTHECPPEAVSAIPEENVKLIEEAMKSLGTPFSPSEVVNLPELTPITSLAELKYACDNNGSFFKLDLETGLIVPINVCIKKNEKQKSAVTVTKAVIDLTDDADNTNDPAATSTQSKISTSTLNTAKSLEQKSAIVKPVKMFKAVHPGILKKRAFTVTVNDKPITVHKTFMKKKRKENIDVRIDLVDSDAPMEEEYLNTSSDSDDDAPILRKAISLSVSVAKNAQESKANNQEGSDDSDDEPLAKKVKRKMEQGENVVNENEAITSTQESDKPQEDLQAMAVDEPEPMDVPIEAPLENIDSLNVEGGESDLAPALDFLDDESDESQDDCILGV